TLVRAGQAAGRQIAIVALAVRVGMSRRALSNGWRALVLWSRCRSRSMVVRHRPIPAVTARQAAMMAQRGRLAVAVPLRVAVMAARRAAVNDISRGCTGRPARRPLRAGAACLAAAR